MKGSHTNGDPHVVTENPNQKRGNISNTRTTAKKPAPGKAGDTKVTTGGMAQCFDVTATEIDNALATLLHDRYLSARTVYSITHGEVEATEVIQTLRASLTNSPVVYMPTHIRNHWVLVTVTNDGYDGFLGDVFDSAPSPMTVKDLRRVLRHIKVQVKSMQCVLRQPYNSRECGLHVIAVTCALALGELPTGHFPSNVASLNDVRPLLLSQLNITTARRVRNFYLHLVHPSQHDSNPYHRVGGCQECVKTRVLSTPPDLTANSDRMPFTQCSIIDNSRVLDPHGSERQVFHSDDSNTSRHNLPVVVTSQNSYRHDPYVTNVLTARQSDISAGASVTESGRDALASHQREFIESITRRNSPIYAEAIDMAVEDHWRTEPLSENVRYVSGIILRNSLTTGDLSPFTTGEDVVLTYLSTDSHFAACAIESVPGRVWVRESLLNAPKTFLSFAELLATFTGRQWSTYVDHSTPRQIENECAIETANNLIFLGRYFSGTGNKYQKVFTRKSLARITRKVWLAQGDPNIANTEPAGIPTSVPSQQDAIEPTHEEESSHEISGTSDRRQELFPIIPPGAQVLSSAQLVKTAKSLRSGQYVQVHWSQDEEASDKWRGVVLRARRGRVVVEYSSRYCVECDEWKDMEPLPVPFPFRDAYYYEVSVLPGPFSSTCECKWATSDSDDDSVCTSDDAGHEIPAHNELHAVGVDSTPDGINHISAASHSAFSFADERETNSKIGYVSDHQLLGDAARRWKIFENRPPHVHVLTWRQYAAATRKSHIRWLKFIQALPSDLYRAPLPAAILEGVLRYAKVKDWKWATLATNMSAICSALENLQLYTTEVAPVVLKKDMAYLSALKRAQHLARIDTKPSDISKELSRPMFLRLVANVSDPHVRLLFQLCWKFAARIHDLSLVWPSDLSIERTSNGRNVATVLFRFGKGARFWGPYSIKAVVDDALAKSLQLVIQQYPPNTAIFRARDKRVISDMLKNVGLTTRGIRRGALLYAAQCGLPEDDIQLLSGHRKRTTLLRYLGWGTRSDAARAAALRFDEIAGAGIEPPKMGQYSGFCGHQGRRIRAAPQFIPLRPPSRSDLGILSSNTSAWPLHVKQVEVLDWDRILDALGDNDLRTNLELARSWCSDPTLLRLPRTYQKSEIPRCRLLPAQVQQLIEVGKIAPFEGVIRGYSAGFLVEQPRKQSLRPIFEPIANQFITADMFPRVSYPSRLERRQRLTGMTYVADFDFKTFYDQIAIPHLADYMVVRVFDGVSDSLFKLTRLPMGSRFAPFVAQSLTWSLVYPIVELEGVVVLTMLDNVIVAAQDPEQFVNAVQMFLARCDSAGIQLNDQDEWRLETPALCAKAAQRTFDFLGETFCAETVRNTENNVEKLRYAYNRLCEYLNGSTSHPVTRRQFAALMGLIAFMTHTLNIPLSGLFTVMRAYSAVASLATLREDGQAWDAPIKFLSGAVRAQLSECVRVLLSNTFVVVPPRIPPTYNVDKYDIVCVVDASHIGWAAIIYDVRERKTVEVSHRWMKSMYFSASAEPKAAILSLKFVRKEFSKAQKIALVTDHIAIVNGQNRWFSGTGGFSSSYLLNELYFNARSLFKEVQFFHIQGHLNVADELSRAPRGCTDNSKILVPDLRATWHPFILSEGASLRPTFQV